jgi:DNA modification methylase
MNAKHLESTSLTRGSNVAGVQVRVDYVSPTLLKPPSRQVRRRTGNQVKRIARSMNDFGCLVPIIVDAQMRIVSGVGRWEAAILLKLTSIPIIRVEHLTEGQLRLFAIADNKLPEGVQWVEDELRIELAEIELLEPELDLTSSGFAIAEIDTMYGYSRTAELSEYDEPVEVEEGEPVIQVGDRWKLGRHDLGCGDARDRELLRQLLGEREARIMLCDPPWNLKIKGVVSGQGKIKHDDFVMAAGEMSRPTFVAFLTHFIQAAQSHLIDGALMYIFMDWRNLDALHAAATGSGLVQKNLLVWCKSAPSLGSLYRSQHELIGLYKHGDAPHINNIQLGRHGRNRSNVLFCPGVNTFGKGRQKALETHPTCKPISLLADIILDTTEPGDLVLDPFGGSGSTRISAEKTGRAACLIELDPNMPTPLSAGTSRSPAKMPFTSRAARPLPR